MSVFGDSSLQLFYEDEQDVVESDFTDLHIILENISESEYETGKSEWDVFLNKLRRITSVNGEIVLSALCSLSPIV